MLGACENPENKIYSGPGSWPRRSKLDDLNSYYVKKNWFDSWRGRFSLCEKEKKRKEKKKLLNWAIFATFA